MILTPLPSTETGFEVSPAMLATFATPPQFFKLSGPGALVRLVQFAKTSYDGLELKDSRMNGEFWFEADLLQRLKHQAGAELMQQQAKAQRPFSTPFNVLVGNYVRHCLRSDLAICKDWTNDFDAYVRLPLRPEDQLIALVVPVGRQPAYSARHPQHQAVVDSNIWLEGNANQYVIDFSHPANRVYAGHILGPFLF